MATIEVGIRIDMTAGVSFFGVEAVNKQLVAELRIREIRPGGLVTSKVGEAEGSVDLALSGCQILVPIDNGIVERLHRRPAIGRRNYLFAGSHAGGERAAIAYSILGTCQLTEANPLDYSATPSRASRVRAGVALGQVDELLPDAWKRARAAASK